MRVRKALGEEFRSSGVAGVQKISDAEETRLVWKAETPKNGELGVVPFCNS
jgi:hypothetical protein